MIKRAKPISGGGVFIEIKVLTEPFAFRQLAGTTLLNILGTRYYGNMLLERESIEMQVCNASLGPRAHWPGSRPRYTTINVLGCWRPPRCETSWVRAIWATFSRSATRLRMRCRFVSPAGSGPRITTINVLGCWRRPRYETCWVHGTWAISCPNGSP